jgi:hypothetical protein
MGAYIVKRLAERHYEKDSPHRQWQGKKEGSHIWYTAIQRLAESIDRAKLLKD